MTRDLTCKSEVELSPESGATGPRGSPSDNCGVGAGEWSGAEIVDEYERARGKAEFEGVEKLRAGDGGVDTTFPPEGSGSQEKFTARPREDLASSKGGAPAQGAAMKSRHSPLVTGVISGPDHAAGMREPSALKPGQRPNLRWYLTGHSHER